MRFNMGCGRRKLAGFVNVDSPNTAVIVSSRRANREPGHPEGAYAGAELLSASEVLRVVDRPVS